MVNQFNQYLVLLVPLAPLISSVVVAFFGTKFLCNIISHKIAHTLTIFGILMSFFVSIYTLFTIRDGITYDFCVYTWMIVSKFKFEIGFLIDNLTATMMCVVTFVSLIVHIYSIGYMKDDESYNRFFSYISLFTFSMLILVMSNNFLQLFFAWEGVGLCSYLLIGFWYTRQNALKANMQAFLVNRIGDFGFILGICLVGSYTNSVNYHDVFSQRAHLLTILLPGTHWMMLTTICICLFIGAMGKSAQFPLHIWLPDSMEGPTPISALIHAATMVTAGIFMVVRMSPLFELSDSALSFMLVIGAITAFLMGLIGIVQNDIKRIVAYSTLSQLGYMTVALGASAYSIAIFHLIAHAFFKALLFLSAGSVIISMHHNQDIRNMGGLCKYMPITCIMSLLASLALVGMPPFSGFYSKDSIIEVVEKSTLAGSQFAYFALLSTVFLTAFYTFRMYFIVFHGRINFQNTDNKDKLINCVNKNNKQSFVLSMKKYSKESSLIITLPLLLLMLPTVFFGYFCISSLVYGDFFNGIITIHENHVAFKELKLVFYGPVIMAIYSLKSASFWLMISGISMAYYFYVINPSVPVWLKKKFLVIFVILDNRFYLDKINNVIFVNVAKVLGNSFWLIGDKILIDNFIVNNIIKTVNGLSRIMSQWQSGYIYHYAFIMIISVLSFLVMFVHFLI